MSTMPESGDESWPERPDPWQEADDRWAEAEATDAPVPPAAEPAGSAIEAYGRGMKEAGPYLGLGLQIAGSMALFTGAGYFLDLWLGTSPWGIIAGAVLAFVGTMALVVRLAKTPGR